MRFGFACFIWCGCQSPLVAPIEAYGEARYPDAASELRTIDVERLTPADRARFELYAGLNHLALGNFESAVQHLSSARNLLEAHPARLSPEDQARLFAAWRALGRAPGQALRSGVDP
jgi:hypothetical protein